MFFFFFLFLVLFIFLLSKFTLFMMSLYVGVFMELIVCFLIFQFADGLSLEIFIKQFIVIAIKDVDVKKEIVSKNQIKGKKDHR